MAQDIFGFDAEYRGIGLVTARNMVLVVAGSTENTRGDYLVQNVAINYQQPIQIIRELSTGNAYYHALPPQGTVSIGRIVGQRPITILLGTPGQNVWKAPDGQEQGNQSRTVILKSKSNVPGPTYKMFGCIVENFSGSTDANSSFVQENVVIRFGKLSID